MSRKLTAVAALAAAAVTLAAVAAAGPMAAKQRVAIELTGAKDSFVLTPLTAGAVKPDRGGAAFCCWSTRHITRDGQAIDVNNPQMTLTGKRGTLVARNEIDWVDLPDGWAAMTGTWKVIRGTGVYAGLSGGGRGAGVALANGEGKSRFEGFLSATARKTSAAAAVSVTSANNGKPVAVPPDAVLIWNTDAVNAVRASSPMKFQTDGMVYMSYVQAAVYDAVTKLAGRYAPYHDFAVTVVPGASVPAAVAAAAQTILDHYLPDQQAAVDAEYSAYLATLTGDVADGVTVGQAAANDIIALRTGDGLNAATPSYGEIGPILPGQWQLQPGQKVQTPWLATMRPFLLDQASQFRAPPPPALTSRLYAKDLNETEAYGALNSTVRTPAETAIAYFWVGNNINQYNETFQNVVAQHKMDLVDAAHLFAMGNIVTTDAGIACYDSKFFYQFWRPITAIQNADKDGNPETTVDPTWQPLLPVPGHPEYPSQHGCFTAAFSDTLAAALHSQHLDVTVPGGQNGSTVLTTTQHFNTVAEIQHQIVDARVWLGFHFRNSVEQGLNVGNNVADWELAQYFKPVHS